MQANSGLVQLKSGLLIPQREVKDYQQRMIDYLEERGIPRRVAIANAIQAVQANDSVLVTPGSGATIATHTAGSKEHQVIVNADQSGHLIGSKPTFIAMIPSQVHVAAANAVHWDLFNADAAVIIRVHSVMQIPNITTAVTGIVFDWKLARTTSVGTGGGAITPWLADTSNTVLDADVTCRSKPTGGAAEGTILRNYSLSSEETNAATIQIASQGGLELVPEPLRQINWGHGIVLRQNQGLRCVQITNSNAGNTGWLIGFTME